MPTSFCNLSVTCSSGAAGDIELVALRKMSRTEADCLPELIARCDVVINAFAD